MVKVYTVFSPLIGVSEREREGGRKRKGEGKGVVSEGNVSVPSSVVSRHSHLSTGNQKA